MFIFFSATNNNFYASNSKNESSLDSNKITVAFKNMQEPFSFIKNNRRTGFCVELWSQIANELQIKFDTIILESADEVVQAVGTKKADIGVGGFSVSSKREILVDFSNPFFDSGYQIMVKSSSESSFFESLWSILGNFFSWQAFVIFLIIIAVLLIVSHIVWFFERKVNPEMWPTKFKKGFWESIWWTISVLLVGGADNKGPIGVAGRVVGIMWMFLSVVIISFFTANLTSKLTINTLKSEIDNVSDLVGKKVGTITGSTAEPWCEERGLNVIKYKNIKECVHDLQINKLDAIIYDVPFLKYIMANGQTDDLILAGPVYERHNYAFAIHPSFKYREKINQVLLKLVENGIFDELVRKYFGTLY